MQAHKHFLAIWATLPTMQFDPEWKNGTGYLNDATKARVPTPTAFIDDADRRGIMLPTEIGTLVVFERYCDGVKGVLVSNSPGRAMRLFHSSLSAADMDVVAAMTIGREVPERAVKEASLIWDDAELHEKEMAGKLKAYGYQVVK